MLFVSHLALVLSIIFGMSYSRYQHDWSVKVEYLADMSASHLTAYNTFFSGSVAGRNYANLLMQSTLDSLKSIPNLKFAEISGTSDYSKQPVKVRYSIEKSKGWRLDVTVQEAKQLAEKLSSLTQSLAATPENNTVHIKKLNHLINKVKVDLAVVEDNLRLQSLTIPTVPSEQQNQAYYLDEKANLLFVKVVLRNKNGGYFRAVVDASALGEIKRELLTAVLFEAMIALTISFFLIYLVTFWLVSPVKTLAASMKQDIEKIDQSQIPEIKRADEIGDLARSYSSLITKIKNQLRLLHNQTETDPLTGIGSRLKYQKHAAKTIQAALTQGQYTYLVMCDIDNFKLFNDSYGHTEGDNVLTEVANTMINQLTPQELGCRLGGEEFVFILCGNDINQLKQRIEALRLAIEQLNIAHRNNPPHKVVTISIGAIPILSNRESVTIEQLDECLKQAIVKADEQLYRGKEYGRNVVMYSEKLMID
ncbi:diguanylate cyclase [Vibrio galatheae]|uniref:diguanylate cyclase n=2 Tax=Vibrio galatheae TaxID=579748 RepID=A0A0F4NIM3_9VIBR|nr:diguanylate cyclase [Vibrio galatheae]